MKSYRVSQNAEGVGLPEKGRAAYIERKPQETNGRGNLNQTKLVSILGFSHFGFGT